MKNDRDYLEAELSTQLARVTFLCDQLTLARLIRLADLRWGMVTRGRLSILLREICQLVAQADPGGFSLVLVPRREKPDNAPSIDL